MINKIDEKGKFDEVVEEKGVKIIIDPKALMHVIGTKMDFVDDKLRYLYCCLLHKFYLYIYLNLLFLHWMVRSEFIFINPNSKGQCGCGESFMTTANSKQGSS